MAEKKKHAGGRPPKVKVSDLIADVDAYLASTALPIVAEYAHEHNITHSYLCELVRKEEEEGRSELSQAIKRITETKAIRLEKGALAGKFVPSMAIFSLKQLGWRDKPKEEGEKNGGVTIIDDFK